MEFILYSDVDERSISNSLGVPEYSYFFVLKAYQRALEQHAVVHIAHSHAEIITCHARLLEQGKSCIALIFSPPHKAPVDLPCPTLCVVAWEYDRIPDEVWDDEPRNDWRYVFARHGAAITLSEHTARAIKAAMGEDFPVLVLPTPLWQQLASQRQLGTVQPVVQPSTLDIRGCIIDTQGLGLSADGLIAPILEGSESEPAIEPSVVAAEPVIEQVAVTATALTVPRRWLITKHYLLLWYREALADLVPSSFRRLLGHVRQVRRSVQASFVPKPHSVERSVGELASTTERLDEHPQAELPNTENLVSVDVSGVVYVSVFNPQDGRKNWEQMVTAFCWAFKEVEDATLILKITQRDLASYYVHMLTLLSQLAPFKCRVLVMHGFLDDEQFSRLYSAASYYVNHSLCEGLCLPLMEFMACGKPVLAPNHTAMADYIDDQVAFVTPSGLGHSIWSNDPRILYRSLRHRPDWGALVQAYKDSYQLAKEQPKRYAQMSAAALERMQEYAGEQRFLNRLGEFVYRYTGVEANHSLVGETPC